MNNYYIWKLAETYVPYLSVKFRDIVKIYNADLTGEKELPPRWETCVSLLQRFMGFGVAASIEQHIENKRDIEDEIKTVFENIRETIRTHVDNNQNLVPELRDHVLDKVRFFSFYFSQRRNILLINRWYVSVEQSDRASWVAFRNAQR